jgi:hypothetical protein
MLRVPTVFVIGAGAGVDVGMPLGDRLSQIIGDKLLIRFEEGRQIHGDSLIMDAIRNHAAANKQDANLYIRVASNVAGGIAFSRSIDSYLYAHKDNGPLQVCGKLAIARTILEHEKRSALAVQKVHLFSDQSRVAKSWLPAFMYVLVDQIVVSENLSDILKHVTIINFNYDRCVEHFLFHAIQAWSLKDEREVANLLGSLTMYHPYGSVGDLPWQSGEGIEFGGEADEFRLLKCSSRIRTFNEEVEDKVKIGEIQNAVANAKRVIFLGFHFHPQNMELIKPPVASAAKQEAYGTVLHRSGADSKLIEEQISKLGRFERRCYMLGRDCAGLFSEFGTTWLS